ncbi:DUF6230 family protein [Natrinema salaciae]|uniref:Uncharacterized protein n=1 Tax=Natrinema salaciae TaxID=1186196 RepID=A0A1H9M5W3_9EURY|nr:DUF6230 family protein [Natrinema salaciae]SER19088.1 hypothetical protein SAMN04489841_3217 [Natrinema salaciae]
MPIDRTRFTAAFLVTNVFLITVLGALATAGVTVAAPITGAGGFTVAFDELHGEGFEQYSTMEGHDGCERYPVSETRIDNGTIDGLHLFTDLEMPITDKTVRVSIAAENASFQGLNQRFTHLEGDIAFEEDQVVEYDDDHERMRISASNITIENGTIQTETQYITHLSLDELAIDVELDPDDAGVDAPEIDCQANTSAENTSSGDGTATSNSSDRPGPGGNDSVSPAADGSATASVAPIRR